MAEKKLAGGQIAYYWQPPTWASKAGCPVQPEPLGTDYADAKRRCDDILNPQFRAWRTDGDVCEGSRPLPCTFDWLVSVYKSSPKYQRLMTGSQHDYDRVLTVVSNQPLKDGRRFGSARRREMIPMAGCLRKYVRASTSGSSVKASREG